jgi:hypothetical protein
MDYEKLLFDRSASTMRVHGILSIIFGGLGVLAGLIFTIILAVSSLNDSSYDSSNSALGLFIVGLLIFVFWVLPHVYLIVAGSYLIRQPTPKLAKVLIIINLVIGVFWNLVLLIFAIINLTELGDYERGYHVHRKHLHKAA